MPPKQSSLPAAIGNSLTSGEFPAAVLWGALASGLLAIVEYNLTMIASEGVSASVSYAPLVGGVVAGLLYAGPRERARTAGAYATAIPTLVLSTMLAGFLLYEFGSGETLNWLFVVVGLGVLTLLAIVTAFGALFGCLSAPVTHWAVEVTFGRRGDAEATRSQ